MSKEKVRKPVVAGSFYHQEPKLLREQIRECFLKGPGRLPEKKEFGREIKGVIVPHAGYIYSGPVAAYAYLELAESKTKDTVIIVGPSHTGLGAEVSIQTEGVWEFPLGEMEIDQEIAKKILEIDVVREDESAFAHEHSIEVQLPFLRYAYGSKLKFVPICMLNQTHEVSRELGLWIAKIIKESEKDILVLGTSDFTHYESQEVAEEKDHKAIEPILVLDDRVFMEKVLGFNISICGYGAITTTIIASKNLGARSGKLLKYGTSGDITGQMGSVVGYSSIVFL